MLNFLRWTCQGLTANFLINQKTFCQKQRQSTIKVYHQSWCVRCQQISKPAGYAGTTSLLVAHRSWIIASAGSFHLSAKRFTRLQLAARSKNFRPKMPFYRVSRVLTFRIWRVQTLKTGNSWKFLCENSCGTSLSRRRIPVLGKSKPRRFSRRLIKIEFFKCKISNSSKHLLDAHVGLIMCMQNLNFKSVFKIYITFGNDFWFTLACKWTCRFGIQFWTGHWEHTVNLKRA